MKKSILFLALLIVTTIVVWAQVPQALNYQAVVRNSDGAVLKNQQINLQLSLHEGTTAGTIIYQETQPATTNGFGLFSVEVGTGSVTQGIFAEINWGSGPKFLQVEFDPAGGSSYINMGTTLLVSVPYSLYAEKSNSSVLDGDTSAANELQQLSKSGTDLSISLGNTVNLSDINTDSQTLAAHGDTLFISGGNILPVPHLLDTCFWIGHGTIIYNKNLNGKIGIGTTTPVARLGVQGAGYDVVNIGNRGGDDSDSYIYIGQTAGSGYGVIGAYKGDTTGPANLVLQPAITGGHVGVGAQHPTNLLQVDDGTTGSYTPARFGGHWPLYITANWPNIGFNSYWDAGWKYGSPGYAGYMGMDPSTGRIFIGNTLDSLGTGEPAAVNQHVSVLSNGNVGIGTTTPARKLDVVVAPYTSGIPTGNDGILARDSNNRFLFLAPGLDSGIYNPLVKAGDQAIIFGRASRVVDTGNLVIGPEDTLPHGIRMLANGNVGIGLSYPSASLHVNNEGNNAFYVGVGGNLANTTAQIRNSLATIAASADAFSTVGAVAHDYYNSGHSPSWRGTYLKYYGTGATGMDYGIANSNTGLLIFQNTEAGIIGTNGQSPVYIAPYSTTGVKATFTPDGNVGIGTTNPANKLHIEFNSLDAGIVMTNLTNTTGGFRVGTDYNRFNIQKTDQHGNFTADFVSVLDNGNMGIGTIAPGFKLDVHGSNNIIAQVYGTNAQSTLLHFANSNSGTSWNIGAGSNNGWSNNNFVIDEHNVGQRLVIAPGGSVGIGTIAPEATLHVNGTIKNSGTATFSYHNYGANSGIRVGDEQYKIYSENCRMYMESNPVNAGCGGGYTIIQPNGGRVGIGTINPDATLQIVGNIHTHGIRETSDARFKTAIHTISNATAKLMQLRGVEYLWNTSAFPERNFDINKQLGVIAQEVAKVLPEVVHTDFEGYKSVEYNKLIPVVIQGFKEQQVVIEKLQKQLQQLLKKKGRRKAAIISSKNK